MGEMSKMLDNIQEIMQCYSFTVKFDPETDMWAAHCLELNDVYYDADNPEEAIKCVYKIAQMKISSSLEKKEKLSLPHDKKLREARAFQEPLFMGSELYSLQKTNLLRDRLDYALIILNGMQQNGGQGTEFNENFHTESNQIIDDFILDVITAFGKEKSYLDSQKNFSFSKEIIYRLVKFIDFLYWQITYYNDGIDDETMDSVLNKYENEFPESKIDETELLEKATFLAKIVPDEFDSDLISKVFRCNFDLASKIVGQIKNYV